MNADAARPATLNRGRRWVVGQTRARRARPPRLRLFSFPHETPGGLLDFVASLLVVKHHFVSRQWNGRFDDGVLKSSVLRHERDWPGKQFLVARIAGFWRREVFRK